MPGTPQSWLDFLSCVDLQLLSPASLSVQIARLKNRGRKRLDLSRFFIPEDNWRSARTVENIRRLQQPDSVAVIAAVDRNLFGGAASQFYKCLTAIKVSEELATRSISAVPVCWIREESISKPTVAFLDSEGELHSLLLKSRSESELLNETSDLISRIEQLGRGTFDPEVLQILRDAYAADTTLAAASARIFSGFMKEWGLVSLNLLTASSPAPRGPEIILQNSALPVIASIIGSEDVSALTAAPMKYATPELTQPIAWPALSVTISDSRSRRNLEKYNLSIGDLFAGEITAINRIKSGMPTSAKLSGLRSNVEKTMAELEKLVSANDFLTMKNSCEEKIIYQIEKLRKNLESAIVKKQQVLERQLHRTCNFLAPNGHAQERELAGIYFLLRYSSAILSRLYERLDWTVLEHQLLAMD